MNKALRKVVGSIPGVKPLRDESVLMGSYLGDWWRFRFKSGMSESQSGLYSRIVMDAHRLEKGLTLEDPRPWFGREVIGRLIVNLDTLASDDVSESAVHAREMAYGALQDYTHYFSGRSDRPGWCAQIETHLAGHSEIAETAAFLGGYKEQTERGDNIGREDFDYFVRSRESVRRFTDEVVPSDVIDSVLRLASHSPSVCNRQGSLCRVYSRGDDAQRLLKHQNGNRGFGHAASHVLLVTHDLGALVSAGERNQAFVDGGMYAMTLLYALHAYGIAACPLNWSATARQDRALRNEISLPDDEVVIMMVAIGYAAPGATVAKSPVRENRAR